MKILVKYYLPEDIFGEENIPNSKIVECCFRTQKYDDEFITDAVENSYAYYNWILKENEDVSVFIKKAFNAIKKNDLDWLRSTIIS